MFQAVPPAPGRPAAPGAQPQVTQPAPEGAAQGAPPPQPAGEPPSGFSMLFPILLLLPLLILMFWSSRSQQKKQAAALSQLKKGDRVVTQAGIVGKLIEIGDRYAKLEVAPGVKVEMLKSGIAGKDTGDVQPAKKD